MREGHSSRHPSLGCQPRIGAAARSLRRVLSQPRGGVARDQPVRMGRGSRDVVRERERGGGGEGGMKIGEGERWRQGGGEGEGGR